MNKKSQSSVFASVLIIVIALALIIYIVAIPPEYREELLEGRSTSSTDKTPEGIVGDNEFIFRGPGVVDRPSSLDKNQVLPSINLRTRINNEIFIESASFIVSRSFRDDKMKILSLYIEDPDNVDNVHLSFSAPKRNGILKITLNDNTIFEGELDKNAFSPLRIPKNMLMKNNIITFSVSGVGIYFWRKNEYIIENFKVFGDSVKTSEQSSLTSFQINPVDYDNLERVSVSFYPSCNQGTVGRLIINVNDNLVLDQIPDCEILNRYDIPINYLRPASNFIEFKTLKDSYLIDRIEISTKTLDTDDLIYYFDLSKDLFTRTTETRAVCGESDGICPDGCSPYLDKDCCFQEFSGRGYWCSVPTRSTHQRCVGRVDEFNFLDCPSGYEDNRGRPHPDFKGLCGDDTDGKCPEGCSIYYDKDCCLKQDMFWCQDLPLTGVSGKCVPSVTNDECELCPSGYVGKTHNPDCSPITRSITSYESSLKSNYQAKINLRFVDDKARKVGIIRVNGYETSFNTYDGEVEKIISRFVKEGTNYVQIIPQNRFNLVNIKVRVDE